MKQPTLEEKSAGGVVYRLKREFSDSNFQFSRDIEFLIGKHSGYHKWVLPKGLVERGESEQEAAVREVAEEVGVEAQIVGMAPIKIIEYWYYADFGVQTGKDAKGGESIRRVKTYQEEGAGKTRVHKQVIFYLMEMQKDLGSAGWEMSDRKWVTYEEGMKTLEFETEREVFEEAGKVLCASGQN